MPGVLKRVMVYKWVISNKMLENMQLHQNDFDFFACIVQYAQLPTEKEKGQVSILTIRFA